jgi:trk system potassium uptake protein TrkH
LSYLSRLGRLFLFWRLDPPQLIALSFLAVISVGTALLMLPISVAAGGRISFIDALFTATSAVCVTGLTVVDTGGYFSTFGQVVVLALIQVGGLGMMTLSTSQVIVLGGRMGIRGWAIMRDVLDQAEVPTLKHLITYIVKMTFVIELAGTVILFIRFSLSQHSLDQAFYFALFHSVSAFNNAGFSLYSDSLVRYQGDLTLNLTVSALIILGGLGFLVVADLQDYLRGWGKKNAPRYALSVHTKIVLTTTVGLILGGAVLIYALESANVLKDLPFKNRILASYFQSVTTRTAGFNTLDIGALSDATLLIAILLMFTGASPGSTGGGIKTTTFAILVTTTIAMLADRDQPRVFKRLIPREAVHKAIAVTILSITALIFFTVLLLVTEGMPFIRIVFETVSAFATVGLSTGITPVLSVAGKTLVVILMYIGRIGPLTLALAIGGREEKATYEYPEEKVMVG